MMTLLQRLTASTQTFIIVLRYFMNFLEPYSQYNVSLNAITNVGNGTEVIRTARTNESSMYISISVYAKQFFQFIYFYIDQKKNKKSENMCIYVVDTTPSVRYRSPVNDLKDFSI